MYSAFAVQARQGDPGPGRWSGSFLRALARGKLFGSDHRPLATDRSPDPVLFLTSCIGQASENKMRPSRIGDERVIARGATPFRLEQNAPSRMRRGGPASLFSGTSFCLRLKSDPEALLGRCLRLVTVAVRLGLLLFDFARGFAPGSAQSFTLRLGGPFPTGARAGSHPFPRSLAAASVGTRPRRSL